MRAKFVAAMPVAWVMQRINIDTLSDLLAQCRYKTSRSTWPTIRKQSNACIQFPTESSHE